MGHLAVLLESAMANFDYREINIGPGGIVIMIGAYTPHEQWLALVDFARRVESVCE